MCYLFESVAADSVGYGRMRIPEILVCRPVVSDLWKAIDAHKDHEADIRPYLLSIWCPLLISFPQTLFRIPIRFFHNHAHKVVVEEERENAEWVMR